jgi:hypothetical protein
MFDEEEEVNLEPIQMKVIDAIELWYEVYTPANPDARTSGERLIENEVEGEGQLIGILNNYDYADLPDYNWRLYYYITIHLPDVVTYTAAIRYEFHAERFDWEDFFDSRSIRSSLTLALKTTIEMFQDFYTRESLTTETEFTKEGYMPDEALIEKMCEDMENNYYEVRRPVDWSDYSMLTKIHISRPFGNESYLSMTLTFIVLTEILFDNEAYNRKHNREVFFQQVPEMKFYSVWLKCNEMAKGDVALTGSETVVFLPCVECALQVMLSEKGERLIPMLEERKFTKEVRDIWIKTCAKLLEAFPKEADAPEDIDWGAVIE